MRGGCETGVVHPGSEEALGVLTAAPNTYGEVTEELEAGFSQQ